MVRLNGEQYTCSCTASASGTVAACVVHAAAAASKCWRNRCLQMQSSKQVELELPPVSRQTSQLRAYLTLLSRPALGQQAPAHTQA